MIYIDTNVILEFDFLERPDDYIPDGEEYGFFCVTSPVVRELERIKDEHFSQGLRKRAKRCLELLTADSGGHDMTERSTLFYKYQEPQEDMLRGILLNAESPDEKFVAAVFYSTKFNQDKYYVMSDDVGVRLRAEAFLRPRARVIKPEGKRHGRDEFNPLQALKSALVEVVKSVEEASRVRSDAEEPEKPASRRPKSASRRPKSG